MYFIQAVYCFCDFDVLCSIRFNTDIIKVPGKAGAYGVGNNIQIGWSNFSAVLVHRYVCCACGYSEEWIDKEDTGTESNTEAEKGLASDSFKRACVNWGIGRELYSAPFIWVKAADMNVKSNAKGKIMTNDKFVVEKITYSDRRTIEGLAIRNATTGKRVFVQIPPEKEQ